MRIFLFAVERTWRKCLLMLPSYANFCTNRNIQHQVPPLLFKFPLNWMKPAWANAQLNLNLNPKPKLWNVSDKLLCRYLLCCTNELNWGRALHSCRPLSKRRKLANPSTLSSTYWVGCTWEAEWDKLRAVWELEQQFLTLSKRCWWSLS